jgi:hypothetical protein
MIRSCASWWTDALSIIITDRGAGKGLQRGKSWSIIKLSNIAPVREPINVVDIIYPSIVYAGRTETLSFF